MTTLYYLAYGSNLHPARIGARLSRVNALGSIALHGWSLRFHKSSVDGSGKCNLVAEPAGVAYGAVYEISIGDKQRLDTIEGVGNGYRSASIELEGFGETWVYFAEQSHIDERLAPYDWYHAFVVRGAQHHRFPHAYINEIHGFDAVRDHDVARHAHNRAILESIALA